MPTESPTAAVPAVAADRPTACLLHADVHVMDRDCWAVTLDWYATHDHLEGQEARDAYEAAAERKMLDDLVRAYASDRTR